MQYNNLRLFIPVDNLIIPYNGVNGKNLCLFYYSENEPFLKCYNYLDISSKYVKYVFSPYVKKPINVRLDPEYRKFLIELNLKPVTNLVGNYQDVMGKNFFFDTTNFINTASEKWNIKRYFSGMGRKVSNLIIDGWLNTIPKEFQKVLLYTVKVDSTLPEKVMYRKIYPIYENILLWEQGKSDVSFDQLLMYFYNYSEGRYVLLFDKNSDKNSASRIKNILKQLTNEFDSEEIGIEDTASTVVSNSEISQSLDKKENETLEKSVKGYAQDTADPESLKSENPDKVAIKSLAYHMTGDEEKAENISNNLQNLPYAIRSDITKGIAERVLPKEEIEIQAKNPLIKGANIPSLVDHQNPKHILELRKIEFNQNLKQDIEDTFKLLGKEELPLELISISTKITEERADELSPSLIQRFTITLKDDLGKEHVVSVDIPQLTENGTFFIYGQEKSLYAQMVTYPIFFLKPYQGRFQSSYSTFSIFSKQLRDTSYLWIRIANYKIPLIMLLSYKLGIEKALKLFDINDNYTIVDSKQENAIKLPDGRFIVFNNISKQYQIELIQSFIKSIPYMDPNNINLDSQEFWEECLINLIGNRSGIYMINKMWDNIVTPIEVKVLSSRGDPTKIEDIIKYIAVKVSEGYSESRSNIFRQRLRLSEVFTAQLQKLVKSAYSEYLAKRLNGSEATFFINPKKVFTEILLSQNISNFESINPLEELSMLTKITPIGIGGLSNTEAVPEKARNIDPSYYGNIDPLETPDSANVGVQQHLSVGTALTNNRGMFAERDEKSIKPSAILSTTSCMIPFINHDEGARVTMAVSQAKQAFPLKYPENPAVQTGYESYLTPILSSNFIKKSPIDGTILDIKENEYISIKDNKGKIYSISLESKILKSGQGKNGLSIFKTNINIGDKVKKDQIIAEGANISEGVISNGLNLLVAFMPWKGFNFEDGMVVSRSVAEKFVSLHMEVYETILSDQDDVITITNINDKLQKGDILITHSPTPDDVESYTSKRTEVNGIVHNIEIFSDLEPQENNLHIPEKIRDLYVRFKDKYEKIHGKYPEGRFKVKKNKVEGILIRFYIREELALQVGDKLNSRHYNKGVVSLIEEDENMPLTPWGERIEIIYTPISILNRMIPGQLLESYTGLMARKLSMLIKDRKREDFQNIYFKFLDIIDSTENKKYSRNIISTMKSMSNSKYEDLKEDCIKKKFVPIIIPPFRSPNIKQIENALNLLGLKTKYPLKVKLEGEEITTTPVAVGLGMVIKLEHIGEKKIHSRGTGGYISKTMTPTSGKKREGSAYIGEYDLYSLLSYNANVLIDEFFGSLSGDHVTKNEMIAEIIKKGETTFKDAKTNTVREMFVQLMNALHLTTE